MKMKKTSWIYSMHTNIFIYLYFSINSIQFLLSTTTVILIPYKKNYLQTNYVFVISLFIGVTIK